MAAVVVAGGVCTQRDSVVLGRERFFCPGSRELCSVAMKRRTPRVSAAVGVSARVRKSVEERFMIQHEKNVSEERLRELGVQRWSKWECGANVTYRWTWEVDEQIYISKGSLTVTPEECEDSAYFYAGDIVRFPKWLVADLTFEENYEQKYRFLAYGD